MTRLAPKLLLKLRAALRLAMRTLCALAVAIVGASLGYRHFNAPIAQPAGVLIQTQPQQIELPTDLPAVEHGKFQLKPLARYTIQARVLHRRTYRYDRQAALSPVDLAVGWSRMSDSAVLEQLNISQSMRFYWYKYQMPPPIPQEEIVRHSANIHIIPADRQVEKFCKSLRAGELVRLEGELVEAAGPGISRWRSSLRRDDTGNGACELLLVRAGARLDASSVGTSAALVRQ
jgi:hypothetical protein